MGIKTVAVYSTADVKIDDFFVSLDEYKTPFVASSSPYGSIFEVSNELDKKKVVDELSKRVPIIIIVVR